MTIGEYHRQDWCKRSPENLCKGHVLQSYIKEQADNGNIFNKVFYFGDGYNDLCPALLLSRKDVIFVRSGELDKLLSRVENHIQLKSDVLVWQNGLEIIDYMKQRNIFASE